MLKGGLPRRPCWRAFPLPCDENACVSRSSSTADRFTAAATLESAGIHLVDADVHLVSADVHLVSADVQGVDRGKPLVAGEDGQGGLPAPSQAAPPLLHLLLHHLPRGH